MVQQHDTSYELFFVSRIYFMRPPSATCSNPKAEASRMAKSAELMAECLLGWKSRIVFRVRLVLNRTPGERASDRHTYRQTDGQTDGQTSTDRQTHTYMQVGKQEDRPTDR